MATSLFALLCVVALGANKLVWESLYPPPYSDIPATIMIGLSCLDSTNCYIPGGANGVGFRVFKFNGAPNGKWTPIPDTDLMLMMLSIAMGGTPTDPHGAVGGVGFLGVTKGLEYYNSSSASFQLPSMPFEFAEAIQSMDTTDDGMFVVALDQGTSNGVFVSSNGGKSFDLRLITGVPTLHNCSFPQYISVLDESTWFVTMGVFPPQQQKASMGGAGAQRRSMQWRRTPSHSILHDPITKSHRWIRHSFEEARQYRALRKNNSCNFYASVAAKTTDGGRTYTTLYVEDNSTFVFDLISCYDAKHCVATGYNPDETFVYTTVDGENFLRVLSVPSTANEMFNLFAVAHRSRDEVWVAGGMQSQESMSGLFYFSRDGGLTWMQYPVPTPDIGTIMDMDFTADGDGFATGITEFETSTILRYAEQPYYGFFTQCQCVDSNCVFLCQNATFPQGMCLPASSGGSIIFCGQNELIVHNYDTTSCIGSYTNSSMPLNQCLQSSAGNYFKNYCGPSRTQAPGPRRVMRV